MPLDHNHPEAAQGIAHKTGVHQPNAESSIAILSGRPLLPNSGIPLDLNWIQEVRVNTSAVER
ncbi:MAG: hypothetical protein WBP51_03115, partial [Candidatus Sulfotelmatobacter sp.]